VRGSISPGLAVVEFSEAVRADREDGLAWRFFAGAVDLVDRLVGMLLVPLLRYRLVDGWWREENEVPSLELRTSSNVSSGAGPQLLERSNLGLQRHVPDTSTDPEAHMADSVQETKDQATGVARALGEAVGKKVEEVADKSKQAGADAAAGLGRTANSIADSVAEQSPAIADYVRGAGEKIDRLANELRDKKVGDLMSSAVQFGRSQPIAMIAGAALVGFALSRLIKAGVADSSDGTASHERSEEEQA